MMYMDKYINIYEHNLVILKKRNWYTDLCLYLNVQFTGNVGQTVSVNWYQQVL
jgi:hypothetical protein